MSQQINLYDASLERQRDWLALGNVVVAGVVVAVLVVAAGFWARSDLPALNARMASGESQLKAVREQVTVLGQRSGRKPDPRLEHELTAKRELLGLRGEVVATLRGTLGPGAPSYAEYLRGLARQTVSGLWLTGFAVHAGNSMEIRGSTLDPALLPEYIRRLNQEVAFQGQTFAALKMDQEPATTAAPVAPVASAAGAGAASRAAAPRWHEFTLIPALESKFAVSPLPTFAAVPQGNVSGGPG